MNEQFNSNKLSINTKKFVFSLQRESNQKDNLLFGLEILITDRVELKRTADMNFLRVDLDENLTWKDLLSIIENKI